jgi:hypothetical protein
LDRKETECWRKLHNEELFKKKKMDKACSTNVEKRNVCKPERKRSPGISRRMRGGGNIKMAYVEIGRIELFWHRIGTSGGPFRTR